MILSAYISGDAGSAEPSVEVIVRPPQARAEFAAERATVDATQPIDGRKGPDSLMALVRDVLRHDALSGHLFIFFSKRRDLHRSRMAPRPSCVTFCRDCMLAQHPELYVGDPGALPMPPAPRAFAP